VLFSQALRNPSHPIDLTDQNPGSAKHLKKEAIPTMLQYFAWQFCQFIALLEAQHGSKLLDRE